MKKFTATKLTRSVRKHLREEKGRIRKTIADPKEQQQKIAELYARFGVTLAK